MFDAWGAIIKVQDGAGNTLAGLTALDRGYTGHEHLQSVGLINMNARLYDPMLRRFLQVDNYIQDVTNTQNYNQYGYVVNNPLKYTDLSGNAFGDGKDCVGCNNNNYPVYNPDRIRDNKDFADGIKNWVGGWASARNIDEAGTAVGKAFRDAFNFIGRNISSLFGGGSKNSGPQANRSSYVSLNNNYAQDAFAKRFHNVDPYAKPKMTMESINALLKDVDGLNNIYQKSKYKIEISDRKNSGLRGYTINGKYFFYDNAFTSNYKLASTMFHEFYHGFQDVFMGGLAYRIAAKEGPFGYINGNPDLPLGGERYIERTAYEFEWNLGNHSTYVLEGINKYKKL